MIIARGLGSWGGLGAAEQSFADEPPPPPPMIFPRQQFTQAGTILQAEAASTPQVPPPSLPPPPPEPPIQQPPPPGFPDQPDLGPGVRLTEPGPIATIDPTRARRMRLGKLALLASGLFLAGAGLATVLGRRMKKSA